MKADSKGAQLQAASNKRRAQHVTRACNTCRRRKSKCDGVQPICASCLASGHECTWSQDEDNRRPATKQYVESLRSRNSTLESRVAALEAKLTAHGISLDDNQFLSASFPSIGSPASEASPGFHSSASTEYGGDEPDQDVDRLSLSTGKLVLEDDNLHLYGPTSAFINLPPSPVSSPVKSLNSDRELNSHELQLSSSPPSPISTDAPPKPDCDWARYLPTDKVNLTRMEHDNLIDRFFKFFSSWCYRGMQPFFLRDMYTALSLSADATPPKSAHYSPMLHNAMLSVATAYSDDPKIKDKTIRREFAKKAKEYIEIECQKPTLSVVQALALLSDFYAGQTEQTLGFMYFGMSVRMSQALGLSMDSSEWVRSGHISEDDKRDRIWLFWSTFAQDKCWSLYVGRDFSIPVPRPELPFPVPVTEHDKAPWVWKKRPLPGGTAQDVVDREAQRLPPPNNVGMAFEETAKLSVLATKIMDVIYGMNNDAPVMKNRDVTTDIHLQLDTWLNNLPDPLRISRPKSTLNALPHVIMLNLAFNWLTILLHRPFYRATSPSPTSASPPHPSATPPELSVKRCDSAADKIVQLFLAYRRLYGLRFVPVTANQIAFTAGMTYLLCAVQFASKPMKRKMALEGVRGCIGFLLEIGQTWECANQTAAILRGLLREQLAPNEYSPMPTRHPTVEIHPPSATQSRAQSMDQIMEYEGSYASTPPQLSLLTGAVFTFDPDTSPGDDFINDPQFHLFDQQHHSALSQPSTGSPHSSSTYDAPFPAFHLNAFAGVSNLSAIEEGYPSSTGAFQHSPVPLAPAPLPDVQNPSQPAQNPQFTSHLFPNFHQVYTTPGVGLGMSYGDGLPSQPFAYRSQGQSRANQSFGGSLFDLHDREGYNPRNSFTGDYSHSLYMPENGRNAEGRSDHGWTR